MLISEATATGTANPANDLPQLLDTATLARRLNTTERHVRRLVDERRIPFIRVGRFIRFEPAAIAQWLRESSSAAKGYAS